MATIQDRIEQLTDIRTDIRGALKNKGVQADSHNYDKFAEDILSIKGGGTYQEKTVSPDITKVDVKPDDGYDALSKVTVNAMPIGSASTPTDSFTVTGSAPSVSADGTITATMSGSKDITPNVTPGYVSSGTKGTISASGTVTGKVPTDWVNCSTVTADSSSQILTGHSTVINESTDGTAFKVVSGTMPNNGPITGAVITTQDGTYSIPSGYTEGGEVKAQLPPGVAKTPKETITSSPSIEVDVNGKITATNSTSKSITPEVTPGYIISGLADEIKVRGTNTYDLPTLTEKTYNVSSTDQTISKGKYLIGDQTIRAVTTSGISAENIKKGSTIKVGDVDNTGAIKSVTGTFTDVSTISSGQTAASVNDLRSGYSSFIDGQELKGSMPNNETKVTSLKSQGEEYKIPAGYHSGEGKVVANITASVLDNSIISGQAFEEATGDYAWKTTVDIPAGYHNIQKLEKTFSEIFPAPETPGTASEVLLGYQFYDKSGKVVTGTMPNNTSWLGTISNQDGTLNVPDGYHKNSSVKASEGTVKSPDTVATISNPVYNTTDGNFDLTASGDINAPVPNVDGYISATKGTKQGGSISGSKKLNKIAGTTSISGEKKVTPTISKQAISITGVIDAASGDVTTDVPTSGVYVKVKSNEKTSEISVTPQITTEGYGTSDNHSIQGVSTQVGANASNDSYVPIKTGSVSISDDVLTVTIAGNPKATGNISLTSTSSQPSSGYFIKASSGNRSSVSGESSTITKAEGWISSGTNTITSSGSLTNVDVYYKIPTAALTDISTEEKTSGVKFDVSKLDESGIIKATVDDYVFKPTVSISNEGYATTSLEKDVTFKVTTPGNIKQLELYSGGYKFTPINNTESITIPSKYTWVRDNIVINPIPEKFVDSSDVTAITDNVLEDKYAVVKTGDSTWAVKEGTMPNNGKVTEEITGLTYDAKYTIPLGYHGGEGTVGITYAIEDELIGILGSDEV